MELRVEAHPRPSPKQLSPVTSLRRRRKILIAEQLNIVIGDALGFFRMSQVVLDLLFKIREVGLDLDEVLLGPTGYQ